MLQATSRTVSDAGEASSKPHRCYFGGSRYVEKYLFAVGGLPQKSSREALDFAGSTTLTGMQ